MVLLLVVAVPVVLWVAGVFGPMQQAPTAFGGTDIMLALTAIYLVVAVVAMIVLTLMNMGKGRSNSRLGLWVFGGLAVLAIVFYMVGGAAPVTGADGTVFDDVFTLKISDAMIYLAYAALGLTVVFLLWGEIRKALK